MFSCDKGGSSDTSGQSSASGLKIAYVNGDSILLNYGEFRAASESLNLKQRDAEESLQAKGAELEKEIIAYQRKVQSGTLSRNEMESQERRLGAKQEALMGERDQISNALLTETNEINERLQKIIRAKLKEIKEQEGYDFIFSYVAGGPILIADEKYDITEAVLKALNSNTERVDTSKG
jgi:outer membrane protein